jgi:uncharacterized membrane-anchored protein
MTTLLKSKGWLPAGLVLVLAAVNVSVWQKEQLVANGKTVLLQLAPVDPRSLMQGDYMRLDYALTRARKNDDGPATRTVRLKLDAQGVATRIDADVDAPLAMDEARMVMRRRGGMFRSNWRIGSDAYFFQEGTDHIYTRARYGEYRTDAAGESVLMALRDDKFERLGVDRLAHRWQVPMPPAATR